MLEPGLGVDEPLHAPDYDREDAGDQTGGEQAACPGRGVDQVRVEVARQRIRQFGALWQTEPEPSVRHAQDDADAHAPCRDHDECCAYHEPW
jgi:hypothetical protein